MARLLVYKTSLNENTLGILTMEKFVVEIIDNSTGCIVNDVVIEADNTNLVRSAIDPELSNFHPAAQYDLNRDELKKLSQIFSVPISITDGQQAKIRRWRSIDDLPYKVHTNRELILMLEGKKPMAIFVESLPSIPGLDLIPERYFSPYVNSGIFLRKEFYISDPSLKYVAFVKPDEKWRIDEFISLKKAAEKSGWSEEFERREGSLLGYEDWQNDIYIDTLFKRR